MKLEQLAEALTGLQDKYNIDSTDILILNAVIGMWKQGDVRTMQFIKTFKGSSQATAHARMKKLLECGLLTRAGDEKNLRVKKLEPTPKTSELVDYLGSL